MCIDKINRCPLIYPQYRDQLFLNSGVGDRPIYKYYPLKYLVSILSTNEMLINKVNEWEDVYENFLFKQPLYLGHTPVDWLQYTDCIYGQCWTYLKSSDAMWRIYSRKPENINQIDDVAIRVQTTTKKLWDALYTSDMSMANLKIGNIVYLDHAQIQTWLNTNSKGFISSNLNDLMFESLFIKRDAFAHEKELRVIIMQEHQELSHAKYLGFQIDPDLFFDEFVIDPRIKDTQIIDAIERRIHLRNTKIQIRQSNLYKLQHQVNFIINTP